MPDHDDGPSGPRHSPMRFTALDTLRLTAGRLRRHMADELRSLRGRLMYALLKKRYAS